MSHTLPDLPASLAASRDGRVAILRIVRPDKRNAIDNETLLGIETFFDRLPAEIGAVVIHGEGGNFSAGLDLSTLTEIGAGEAMLHSWTWSRAFEKIEFGRVPVVAVLHGATIGGGLELASTAHIRVAERSTFYALPEGQRGIYVGGGASIRLARLIGTSRMMEMMLTGRTFGADVGLTYGFSHYVVNDGAGLAKGIELAHKAAENAPMTNFAIIQALPRIAETDRTTGHLMEAMASAIAQDAPEAKQRMRDFLERRAARVRHDPG
jgi:enoyl-CoA hydratase/carnithine racemase